MLVTIVCMSALSRVGKLSLLYSHLEAGAWQYWTSFSDMQL
ncbi:hypothetical protein [Paenibacillus arenosi]|nr:hypothetical protein [Paenibacillus arenosi]